MSSYRKKPAVLDAVQLRWDRWSEMCEFANVGRLEDGKPQGCYVNGDGKGTDDYPGQGARIGLWIPTHEGLMLGVEGDWIARSLEGELTIVATDKAVPANSASDGVRTQIAEACPARLALCGVPCGCRGRNPSHRAAAYRTNPSEETHRGE